MKGLLLKDIYVTAKQLRLFIALMVIFALVPEQSLNCFAVMYAAIIPMTACACDEQSHWDELALTMPYSRFELAFCKYILAYAGVFGATLLTLISGRVCTALGVGSPAEAEFILSVGCAALTVAALIIPLVLHFGAEKGRFVFLAVCVAAALGALTMRDKILSALDSALPVIAVAVIANVVSVPLAVKFFNARRGR